MTKAIQRVDRSYWKRYENVQGVDKETIWIGKRWIRVADFPDAGLKKVKEEIEDCAFLRHCDFVEKNCLYANTFIIIAFDVVQDRFEER